jgi:CheY-like chemotaxis protein
MKNGIKKVLVVDDDSDDTELTMAALRETCKDANATAISSGVEAFAYLESCAGSLHYGDALPDLILLDVSLPMLSGLNVLRKIKQHVQLRTIPVVMLTNSKNARDVEDSYRSGVNAYVLKSNDYSKYVQAIENICRFWLCLNEPLPAWIQQDNPGNRPC